VCASAEPADLLALLREELQHLANADPDQLDTTLLIAPKALPDFLDFNDFLADCDDLLMELELDGVLQVADFHPHYQFGGTDEDDIANFTNMLNSDWGVGQRVVQNQILTNPAVDANGATWARIAPTSFPRNAGNESAVIHQITAYDKTALWDSVAAWFDGGPPASGTIDPAGSALHRFTGGGGSTWRSYAPDSRREEKVALGWNSFATPIALDEHT
jgi:hypothetical protein